MKKDAIILYDALETINIRKLLEERKGVIIVKRNNNFDNLLRNRHLDITDKDIISINGSTGDVYDGAIKTVPADINSGNFARMMKAADKYRILKVRANADVPRDAKQAAAFGAQGIGTIEQ